MYTTAQDTLRDMETAEEDHRPGDGDDHVVGSGPIEQILASSQGSDFHPGDVRNPNDSQDPNANQVRLGDVQKPEKPQDPREQKLRSAEDEKPEKYQHPDAQQVRPGDIQKPEKPQDPGAKQVPAVDVQKPEKPQDLAQPVVAGNQEDGRSPQAPAHEPGAHCRA